MVMHNKQNEKKPTGDNNAELADLMESLGVPLALAEVGIFFKSKCNNPECKGCQIGDAEYEALIDASLADIKGEIMRLKAVGLLATEMRVRALGPNYPRPAMVGSKCFDKGNDNAPASPQP